MLEKEVWMKLVNDSLKSEKEIHLFKNSADPGHPWIVVLRNTLHGRAVEVSNIADTFDEGMVRVQEHLAEATRLGYSIQEKRT